MSGCDGGSTLEESKYWRGLMSLHFARPNWPPQSLAREFISQEYIPEMDLLTELPAHLAHCLMSRWVTAKEVSQLDIAYCNHRKRNLLLALFSSLEIGIRIPGKLYMNHIRWLKGRNVKCSQLNFNAITTLSFEDSAFLSDYMLSQESCLNRFCLFRNSRDVTHALLRLLASTRVALTCFSVDVNPTMVRQELEDALWNVPMRALLQNSVSTLIELTVLLRFEWRLIIVAGAQFNALRKLTVHGCDDTDLLTICAAAPNLTYIQLVQPDCSDIGLGAIGQHCHALEHFTLLFGEYVVHMDEGLTALAQGCSKLKRIELENCDTLADSGLTAVCTQCTRLERLVLCGNNYITDESIIALAHSACAKSLNELHVQCCVAITGVSIGAIAAHCPALRILELEELWYLTVEQLEQIIPNLKNVTQFKLFRCDMDKYTLMLVAKHMVSLESVSTTADPFLITGLTPVVRECEKLQYLPLCGIFEDCALRTATVALWKQLRPALMITFGND